MAITKFWRPPVPLLELLDELLLDELLLDELLLDELLELLDELLELLDELLLDELLLDELLELGEPATPPHAVNATASASAEPPRTQGPRSCINIVPPLI